MDKADDAIVFIDEHTFQQKNIEPYPVEVLKDAFAKNNMLVLNQPELLLKHLENISLHHTNLLLMSSGNFGGLNLNTLTEKLVKKAEQI